MIMIFRMSHLERTGGEMLHMKGNAWKSVRSYKNGVSTGTSESKIASDDSTLDPGISFCVN